jgi:class 3 adenylate cyclase/Tfp pilus assembly protein PilF
MRFCGNCGNRLPQDTASLIADSSVQNALPGAVGVMMGADLLERFRVAGLNAAGQKRNVTILFVDLSGFTVLSQILGTEDVYVMIQQFTSLLIKDVYKYDGMVDKLMGDGLMAIFGAPIANENSPEMALRSANDMQLDIRQFSEQINEKYIQQFDKKIDLSLHIALNYGEVIVGGIGSNLLMNYTAIGDTVNLAHRLLEVSDPGVMLVSQQVYQQTKHMAEYKSVGPYKLKGIEEPVFALEFIALKETPSKGRTEIEISSPIVGRENELAQLAEVTESIQYSGKGQVILIEGEAGIGKSRLLNEYEKYLTANQIKPIVGHCYTYKKNIQYWILQDILRHYFNAGKTDDPKQFEKRVILKLNQIVPTELDDYLVAIDRLFGAGFSRVKKRNQPEKMDPAQMQNQIFWTIRDLFEKESYKKPIVLIFEDMHWADESSLAFLAYLFKVIPDLPILVAIVTRPILDADTDKLYNEWKKLMRGRLTRLSLGRLSEDHSKEMIKYLLPQNLLPENLILKITHLAGGNPLFLEEIIRMLIDRRLILIKDNCWQLEPTDGEVENLMIPDTLQGLILTRFDQLSSIQRRLLQVASIIGRDFNSDLLRVVLQITDPTLFKEILHQLVRRDIIENYSDFPNQDFRFIHVLMSDTIYSTLLKGDKADLHGQIGGAIEETYPGQVREFIDVLARHYQFSTNYQKALNYTKLAANISSNNYANEQAKNYYNQAVSLLQQVPHTVLDEIEIYNGLGRVNVFSANYPEALENFQTTKEIFIANPSFHIEDISLYTVMRSIGEVYEHLGNYPDAMEYLNQSRNLVEQDDSPDLSELAWIEHDLGWIEYRRGNLERSEELFVAALSKLDEEKNPNLVASVSNRLAGVYFQQSNLEQATKYLQKSVVLREQMGDKVAVARSYNNLGLLKWRTGDWQNALQYFNKSLEINKFLGDVEGSIDLNSNIGLLLLDRGKLSESENYLTTALSLANKLGLSYHIGMICLHLARLMIITGDYDKAISYAEEGRAVYSVIGANENLADLTTFAGFAWLEKGESDKARQLGEEALKYIDEMNPENQKTEDRGRAFRLLARTAIIKGNSQAAEDYLTRSDEIFQTLEDKLENARNLVVRSQLDELSGSGEAAKQKKLTARKIFEEADAAADLMLMK